jgi:hypothetical protein
VKRSEMVALIQTSVNEIAYGGEELCLPSEASALLARIEEKGMLPPTRPHLFEAYGPEIYYAKVNNWEPEDD